MVKLFWFVIALVMVWGVWFVWPRAEPPSRLLIACTNGWDTTVDQLLAAGADPNHATTRFEEYERSPQDLSPVGMDTPLSAAVTKAVEWRQAPGYGSRAARMKPLGDRFYGIVVNLLNHGADPCQEVNGETPTFIACHRTAVGVLDLLIKRGAPVSSRDKDGLTPLHAVGLHYYFPEDDDIKEGEFFRRRGLAIAQCVHLLVRAGADIEARDRYGRTPLHFAALKGDISMADALIADGARVRVEDMGGMTPKDCARTAKMFEFLEKAGG